MSDSGPSGEIFEEYKNGEDIQLFSYGVLAGAFNLIFAGFLLVARLTGRSIPERVDAKDIVLLGMATHKLSLVGSEDAITSPLRAPFTELREKESPKKVDEKPRGEGLRRSVGELLTCKFCLSVWVASLFTYGLVLLPRVTRLLAAMFAIVTVSDHLHQAYKVLMNEASG
ncbi:MAG TPA: DUF1360 domain-containing protein [Rubrobacter sp.]|jgi:hypothetical protein|nr:DUF1360 domain-containing protein [Rubrobacter sp.]